MNTFTFATQRMKHSSSQSHGFTLIELAVALFVMALVLGAIMVPLATQIEQRQISETQKTLDDIREALIGYSVANGNLPCPDATSGPGSNDGSEDVNTLTGNCQALSGTIASGNLPWATLGLANQDTWGNRFRYIILGSFGQRAPATQFDLSTPASTLRVCEDTACASLISDVAVAVVISHGSNGLGAMKATTNTANTAPTSNEELENTNNNLITVYRTKSNVQGSEFDDIVTSVSRFVLVNRMVVAGKLPKTL